MWLPALCLCALLAPIQIGSAAASSAPGQSQDRPSAGRPGTARIAGRVASADSGQPLRRASVHLTTTGRQGRWSATTDFNGRFDFFDLPAGRFTLTASMAGFVMIGAPGSSLDGSISLELREGQVVDRTEVRMSRGGVIAGRLADEFGDPAIDVLVQAFRAQYAGGLRRLVPVTGRQTNDLGHFRIYGLTAGTYYVSATARGTGASPLTFVSQDTRDQRGGSGFAPTFFPGAASAAGARPVVVETGAETGGTDFALLSVRLTRFSGIVVDSRGKPAARYLVLLNPARSDRAGSGDTIMEVTGSDGRFMLPNIPPGEYRLDARAESEIAAVADTGRAGQPQHADAAEFASVPVRIAGEDIDGFTLTTGRGFRMTGRVVVEEGATEPAVLQRIRIQAPAVSAGWGVSTAMLHAGTSVRSDGTFELRGLSGARMVRVDGLPTGWTLSGVRVGGLDVVDEGLEVLADVADVEVKVSAHASQILGAVVDHRGMPVGDVAVIVFPEDRLRWTLPLNRFVTSVRVDTQGRFTINDLPPANYLATVVDRLVDGEWAEEAHLERRVMGATKFSLVGGQTKPLTLQVPER